MLKLTTLTFLSCFFFASSAFAIELTVVNDLNPNYDGRVLEIEDAVSIEAPRNKVSFKLEIGKEKSITGGNVRSFILTRKYPRHKLKYDVSCPKSTEGKGLVTVAKAHENELPGGCKVVRIGHWSKRSGMNWDVTDEEGWKVLQAQRRGRNQSMR